MPLQLTDIPATIADKNWQEEADALAGRGLSQIRATAAAWTATIGALTSLFGLSVVLKGRGDLALLTPEAGLEVGILTLLAVVLGIGAVTLGALAAQGTPVKIWDSGPKLREWSLSQAAIASGRLRCSRFLTFLSLLPLIASLGLDLYGPGRPPESAHLLIVSRTAGILCGTVVRSTVGTSVKPSDNSPTVQLVPGDLISAQPIAKCP